ncbi:nucleotide-binding protein [Streptomyces lunaelactis]|uniref:TIR domain-containing protein n=1 Tax=Streptomyces lunaelactis TaxID=1535768 RepID=UPI001585A845|nr:TIR domain-containing protein [Streptomyces lunaelactis]NUK07188.1 nucleotide-binding protein [Streptomyces lunaelactis]NUL08915.1 nucleotide-binding protein [Streptomyces lunaelactis]NUL21768.1 nucleotide-binding protein [Streptomyces lunaelactis]
MFESIFMKVAHEGILITKINRLSVLTGKAYGEVVADLQGHILDSHGYLLPDVSADISNYEELLQQYEREFVIYLRTHSRDYEELMNAAFRYKVAEMEKGREADSKMVALEEIKARASLDDTHSLKEQRRRVRAILDRFKEPARAAAREELHATREARDSLSAQHQETGRLNNIFNAMRRIRLAREEEWSKSFEAANVRDARGVGLRDQIEEAIRIHATAWVDREIDPKVAAMGYKGEVGRKSKVFLVHGRDKELAQKMQHCLLAFQLDVVEWGHAKASLKQGSPFISDIVMAGIRMSDAVVVLLTPDESVQLRPELGEEDSHPSPDGWYQARPNVYYEAGISDAINRDRTIIVEIGRMRPFSDAAGRHAVRFNRDEASCIDLRNALRNVGLSIDDHGRAWVDIWNT